MVEYINYGDARDPNLSDEMNSQREAFARNKYERIRAYRQEASRLASKANKRIERLEKNDLQSSPAYQKWVKDGSVRFGVKGKTYNEVQAEVARLNNFLNSETSTIRGIENVLKTMADNTGIKYDDLSDLRAKASNFFEIASKLEQYYRTVLDMGSAIGYQELWEVINSYVATEELDLSAADLDIEQATQRILQAMDVFNERGRVADDDMWQVVGLNPDY